MLSTVCAVAFAASLVDTVEKCESECHTGGKPPHFADVSSSQVWHILGRCVEFDQPIPDTIHQPVGPSPPPLTWPTCCHRVGGPPDYAPLMDRQMEWSPIQPGASGGGSSSWAFQLMCFTCSWTFRVEDVPPLPEMSAHAGSLTVEQSWT